MRQAIALVALITIIALESRSAIAQQLDPPVGQWVKLSPLPDGPPSPRMGYETSMGYDPVHRKVLRWAGHNQGGGGEQNAELWTFDPLTAKWALMQPNRRPPGACCNQQNVFDPVQNRLIRFPAFSGSHGWQWFREVYLNNTTVWNYDLAINTWHEMRPLPAPRVHPLRCASWDTDHEVVVLFGGEGGHDGTFTYDPYANTWTKKNPPSEPPDRSGGNMAYDSIHKLHILFGSQFTDDPDTWAYDLAKNEWRALKPKRSPPTNRNDPAMCFDAAAGKVIAVIRAVEEQGDNGEPTKSRLETWAFDVKANTWEQIKAEGPWYAGSRSRVLTYLPDMNVSLLESVTKPIEEKGIPREQQIWVMRSAAKAQAAASTTKTVRMQPRVVEDVTASVLSPTKVELKWSPPPGAESFGELLYHIERAPVEVLSVDQSSRLRRDEARTDTPAVAGVTRVGRFATLTKEPVQATHFTDQSIDLSKPTSAGENPIFDRPFYRDQIAEDGKPYRFGVYAYRVIAMTAKNHVRSGPSPYVLTIPSAPQQVFSREDGATCHIKWAANGEQGLKGYHVYRMDGRFSSKERPIMSRLTKEPIQATTFTDPEAGGGYTSRRYYIVAVDALGQEGYPSSPTWHNREWKPFYDPFVGEWHQ